MPGPGLSLIVGPWARIRQAQCYTIFYPFKALHVIFQKHTENPKGKHKIHKK